ncbi:MAG: amidase [Actinomycetota bacterium]
MEPWRLTATDATAMMARGELTSVDVVESVLERIDARNGEINALTTVDPDGARAAARKADEQRRAGGPIGPLHGVPVTIKGNLDVAGEPTTSGVTAFADKLAPDDAPAVSNLRRAGAIVIGRTNLPEFGIRGTTFNPLYGRTANPWHPEASPGGSSGGAGAAAAAGFGPLHQGSDIGGSLRFPAFGCGVATIKPTSHRVPAFNSSSSAERGVLSQTISCIGMISPTVADVRLATEAMIAPDPRDPNSPPVPWCGPDLPTPLTVAVSHDWGPHPPHPGIVSLIDRAASQLDDAGYRVVEIAPPPIEEAFRSWLAAASTELAVGLGPVVERFGSDDTRQLLQWTIDAGELLDRDGYMWALGDRTRIQRTWNLFLDEHPLILCPFMTQPMYDWDFDVRSFEAVNGVLERAMHAFGVNFLGLPAGVIGMDLVEDRPAGVQVLGRRYREDLVCDALEAIEHRNGVMAERLWSS